MPKSEVLETMIWGYVTWSPRSGTTMRFTEPITTFHLAAYNDKELRTDHNIFYRDILPRKGSGSIAETLSRRRILFAMFVMRVENTGLPQCVMFGELVGRGCFAGGGRGGRKRNGWGAFWATSEFSV